MSGRKRPKTLRGTTVALVGAGGLAHALAPALLRAGAQLRLAARRPAAARALLRKLDSKRALLVELDAVAESSELLLLCVPDDALAPLARQLARRGAGRGRVALHASGFQGLRPLAALARAGWSTGWLHPLLPLPRAGAARADFAGAWFATGGERRAAAAARELVRATGGRELALHPTRKPEYHLAATLVSNGALALFELARVHFERAARRPREARAAFAALLAATAANLVRTSPREALTGPVARGDLDVLRGHLARLRTRDERELYRALGRILLELGAPRLAPSRRRALAQFLRSRSPR